MANKLLYCQVKLVKGDPMKKNEGTVDRVFRVIIGLSLLSLIFTGPQTMWGLVGFVPLLTGVIGFCPLYKVFKFDTCPVTSKQ